MENKDLKILSWMVVLAVIGLVFVGGCVGEKKEPKYTSGEIKEPILSYSPPPYNFIEKKYDHPEYDLPLSGLPENYQRDIVQKFRLELNEKQKSQLLNNGVALIPGRYDRFENAYSELGRKRWEIDKQGVPVIITTDSVLHLFHIEFNEILKNLEIKKLSPMLNSFLESTIDKSIAQYNGLDDGGLKELSRRNTAYLAVAKKLLDPGYNVPGMVRSDVDEEIRRIMDHKGFYRSPLFSKDCPDVCVNLLYPGDYPSGDFCNQEVKGLGISYQGRVWKSEDLYIQVCSKRCYCEDYSQYVPRGHYTSSEGLKQYFKAMMWLGRMTFKVNGENWTKQAVLLTDVVKSSRVKYQGSEYNADEIWNKIYTVTGFFAGASDDLTFYEYDKAVFNLFNYEFDENENLKQQVTEKMQGEIRSLRGPEILGGFEFDLAGNLKDTTQGLRLIGQRYAIDSHVLSDLVYDNVGPNPHSKHYERVLDCNVLSIYTKPKEFYQSCENMEVNKTKYWNEVCDVAMQMYVHKACGGLSEDELYSVCRFMPTGLDVMSVMGSKKADDILTEQNISSYCGYDIKSREMKELVNSYSQKKWTKNLYNTWLWMLQPVLKEKPEGYPNWMRSELWRMKELVTGISSWAQLRHDTILYVKQSYTRAVMMTGAAPPMEAKYYGYVEPNPELYARAKFTTDYLLKGLSEQGVITPDVRSSLKESSRMMARLQGISEKELEGEALDEEDYDYIMNIDSTFNEIIEKLASALTVSEKKPFGPGVKTHTSLEGKWDAFKTTIIADIHTETNTKKALEVGTGRIDWIIVAHESKEGRIGLAVGPIFSYYEFPWPMEDRLTDEKWRSMLDSNPPDRPEWVAEFIS